MSFLSKMRRRLRIVKHIADETQNAEQHFPYAALTGIGFNAMWWAAVEHQLDLLIFWHSSSRLGDRRDEHPRALVRKLRYLKNIEIDEKIAEEDRDTVRAIRLKMAELSDIRHDFTHSFMDIGLPEGNWPFARLRYEGKNVRLEKKTYDLSQLAQLTEEIRQLVSVVSPLVTKLALPWLKTHESLLVNSLAENA